MQADVAEFGFAETEIAEAEGQVIKIRVDLREEPGGVPVGGEKLHHRFEVEALVLAVDGGELGTSVLEEFLVLGGSDELHGSSPVWADPSGPFPEQTDRVGSARRRMQLSNARSERSRKAAPVTAALRWRGRCGLPPWSLFSQASG